MEEEKKITSEKEKKTRKTSKKKTDGDLSLQVPDVSETSELAPIDIDVQDEKDIEAEAIASLPHEEIEEIPLESLLYDADEEYSAYETEDEAAEYEAALADYKVAMAEAFASVKNISKDDAEAEDPSAFEDSDIASAEPTGDEPNDSEKSSTERRYSENDIILVEPTPPPDEIADIKQDEEEIAEESAPEEDYEESFDGTQMEMDFGEVEHDDSADDAVENDKYDPDHPRKIDTVFEFVELFIFTLVAVMLVTTFFFRHAIVDGPSMQNTLQNGDHLIIYSFLYEPERGDVIVFMRDKPLVKRVIAVEGDTVSISADGDVWVNGELIEENYVYVDGDYRIPDECVVGEDEVYVLGDHRNNSTDSRMFGAVSEDSILGKVILRFYPFSEFGGVK